MFYVGCTFPQRPYPDAGLLNDDFVLSGATQQKNVPELFSIKS
jgi:hypothetical protein